MTSELTQEQINQWCREARELGREAACNAASWLSFDSEKDARELRQLIADGDPRVDEHLPAYPNLSGEWVGEHTPQSLAQDVLGDDWENAVNVDSEIVDRLAKAWDEGCDSEWWDAIEKRIADYLKA